MAFGVSDDQVRGSAWMDELYFDIDARSSPDTTPFQVQAMLAELVKERFDLASYVLRAGKSGPSFLSADPQSADPQSTEAGGGKAPLQRRRSVPAGEPGTATFRMPGVTLEKVADTFSKWLSAPVEDATVLAGTFDVELRFSGHDEESGRVAAQQLGLVLTRSRIPVRVVFVDSIRRTPVPDYPDAR